MAPGLEVVRFMFLSLILWACHSLPDSAISAESLQRQKQPLSDKGNFKVRCWEAQMLGKCTSFSMTGRNPAHPCRGKPFAFLHGRNAGFAPDFAFAHLHSPLCHYQQSIRSCLCSFGSSWLSQAVPSPALQNCTGKGPGLNWFPKPAGEPAIWEATGWSGPKPERGFLIFLASWMLNSCTSAQVLLIFWYQQWQMKKKFRLHRGSNFRTLQSCKARPENICFLSS